MNIRESLPLSYFKSSRISLKPNSSTTLHNHHEIECLVVISGKGKIILDSSEIPLSKEKLIWIKPLQNHKILNTHNKENLIFYNFWWDDQVFFQKIMNSKKNHIENTDSIQIILPSFVTPNGCHHLGHFAGPTLGADFYHRIQSLKGKKSIQLTGTLGYQTHVQQAAEFLKKSYQETAIHYSKHIHDDLEKMSINYNCFASLKDKESFSKQCQNYVETLNRKNLIFEKELPVNYCKNCDKYLFEAHVKGTCPFCHNLASGECEKCGYYIRDDQLLDAICLKCDSKTIQKPLRRLYFKLETYRDFLIELYDQNKFNNQLRSFIHRVLERSLPELPISILSQDGIPLGLPNDQGHVLFSAFELVPRFLTAMELVARQKQNQSWQKFFSEKNLEICLFFGTDNSYLRCVIFPILLHAYDPEFFKEFHFFVNEFYQLEGKKISTSRKHFLRATDLLTTHQPDMIRFYLAYTRPETTETNFSEKEFQNFVQNEFETNLEKWIRNVFSEIKENYSGIVQEAGSWDKIHYLYYEKARALTEQIKYFMRDQEFDPSHCAHLLIDFIHVMIHFEKDSQYLETGFQHKSLESFLRTTINLKLMFLKTWLILTSPFMPNFSEKIYRHLGYTRNIFHSTLINTMTWVDAGNRICDLDDEPFFQNIEKEPYEKKISNLF